MDKRTVAMWNLTHSQFIKILIFNKKNIDTKSVIFIKYVIPAIRRGQSNRKGRGGGSIKMLCFNKIKNTTPLYDDSSKLK